MKKYISLVIGIMIVAIIATFLVFSRHIAPVVRKSYQPTLKQLDQAISKGQKYYETLYQDEGSNGAVIKEYQSSPVSTYTVRHATIGGIFYYAYTKQATQEAQLIKFVNKYGFKPAEDEHSFIWTQTSDAPKDIVFTQSTYHDCFVTLPTFKDLLPYHSKVCKLGAIGVNLYIAITRFDSFVPMTNMLQQLEENQPINKGMLQGFESRFNALGFGMPICTPFSCSSISSTIRTAQFGELEMRLGNNQYADKVADDLLAIQNDKGAFYLSYDKNNHLDTSRPFVYEVLDRLLNDTPVFKGYVPTNAETMNDALAFLFHYRCQRYNICN